MTCCLCGYWHDDDSSLQTHIKDLIVCLCCYDDMDDQTKVAYNAFVENLIRMLPDKTEIYKHTPVDPFNFV
jgi:hypothetical protein